MKKGDPAGCVAYLLDGREIGTVDILAGKDVEKAGFVDYLIQTLEKFRA